MTYLRCIVAPLLLFLCISPARVHAYCGVPEIRTRGEYFQSDVVFTGTVVSGRFRSGSGLYHLRVQKVFRGPVHDQITVSTEDDDNRFLLEKDRAYLLFGYRRNGRLEIDNCGNSGLLSNATRSVRILENISHAPPYGVIGGWAVEETAGIDTSGVLVTVNGRSRNYTVITGKDGWFHFRAPTGGYKIDFGLGEYYLNAADDFRYNPHHFVLHSGESASLQVVSVRHLAK
jgi:hypothetical protein